jgi:hypothetical protein
VVSSDIDIRVLESLVAEVAAREVLPRFGRLILR